MKEKIHMDPPNHVTTNFKTSFLAIILIILSFGIGFGQNGNANTNGSENANENATVEGGIVSAYGSDYIEVCIGDDVEDIVDFHVEGASGRLKQWVITDDEDNILYLPKEPSFDFNNEEEEGVVRVYHLSYNGMKPLVKPFWHKHISNLMTDLRGKYDISDNYIEVKLIQQPDGGEISLADGSTEIEICAGDGNSDLFEVNVTGASGGQFVSMVWVVTETNRDIVMTSTDNAFDFEGDGDGTYLIWHLSYAENVNLEGITNADDLTGCFDLSNAITVIRNGVNAGEIQIVGGGTEIEICAGDGNSDAFDVSITGESLGDNYAWVITDNDSVDPEILGLPPGPPFDLEGEGEGICVIWRIAFEDGLEGAVKGNNVSDLIGCYDLSNPITVTRNGVNAGEIAIEGGGTEIEICAGDGNSDAFDVSITGESLGDNYAWVITDNDSVDPEILGLPPGPPFDLEGEGEGTCVIWRIAFEDGLEGAVKGNNVSDLIGCYDLSNPITVTRNGVNGGAIVRTDGNTDPFSFTVGDNIADNIADGDITLQGNIGSNFKWLVTSDGDDKTILGVVDTYTEPNFEGAGAGTCLIWHISYEDGIEGLAVAAEGEEPNLVANISGCFSLSNSISVIRTASSTRVGLFPNPSKGTVNVDLSNFGSEEVSVRIFSLQNVRLYNKDFSSRNLSRNKWITLNVSSYLDGIYFVSVTDSKTGYTVIKRLVVSQ